jgi:hypothetical protein
MRWLNWGRSFLFILSMLLVLAGAVSPLLAQETRVGDAWQQVYQRLPDLPRENQYVNRESGKVSETNTLISRLIRYHVYIKARPVNYRLDWKLTLADYLGANERMPAATYPGSDTLRTNPMPGDVAAIRSLTRTQRDALVQALVDVFAPQAAEAAPAVPSPVPSSVTPTPPSSAPPAPAPVRESRPGDAQLLLP